MVRGITRYYRWNKIQFFLEISNKSFSIILKIKIDCTPYKRIYTYLKYKVFIAYPNISF